MKSRCYNTNDDHYKNYGERGISICEEWLNDYQVFAEWAMQSGFDEKLTIDRIDNNGDYEPSNCRWVSNLRQANNKSTNILVNIGDKTQSVADWCRELNLNYGTVKRRVYKDKMTYFEALTKPIRVIYPSIKTWNEAKRQAFRQKARYKHKGIQN